MEKLTEEGSWPLPDQAILHLSGEDALTFLHAQVTSAVTSTAPAQARPTAYCTAQGRLLANGIVWLDQDTVHWMVARDLADRLVQRLRLFVLRQKVAIEVQDTHTIRGVCGKDAVPALLYDSAPWSRTQIGDEAWITAPMSTPEHPAAWHVLLSATTPTPPPSPWDAMRLAAGWPSIRAASTEQFLPSALDLDLNGSIDFHKGCYPGQEVVARMRYRGTAKRRLAYGSCSTAGLVPGMGNGMTDLYAAGATESRPIGRVIESTTYQGRLHIAAEIMPAETPQMQYALGTPGGPSLILHRIHDLAARPA